MSARKVKPDSYVHELYDGRTWPMSVPDQAMFLRATILRVINEEIVRCSCNFDGHGEQSLLDLRARFEEVVE